jgi:hypothetical protein
MYCIDKMLPDVPMEDKFCFSKAQMDWVEENEVAIWQHIVDKDLLFSTDEKKFRTFVNYAPFAKGMPPEAPGRVAYYIGYKMVNEYMDNNEIDIEDMMKLTDSNQFLSKSKYKPKKNNNEKAVYSTALIFLIVSLIIFVILRRYKPTK